MKYKYAYTQLKKRLENIQTMLYLNNLKNEENEENEENAGSRVVKKWKKMPLLEIIVLRNEIDEFLNVFERYNIEQNIKNIENIHNIVLNIDYTMCGMPLMVHRFKIKMIQFSNHLKYSDLLNNITDIILTSNNITDDGIDVDVSEIIELSDLRHVNLYDIINDSSILTSLANPYILTQIFNEIEEVMDFLLHVSNNDYKIDMIKKIIGMNNMNILGESDKKSDKSRYYVIEPDNNTNNTNVMDSTIEIVQHVKTPSSIIKNGKTHYFLKHTICTRSFYIDENYKLEVKDVEYTLDDIETSSFLRNRYNDVLISMFPYKYI